MTNLRNESGISSNKGIDHLDVCADSTLFKTCFSVPVSSSVSPFPLSSVHQILYWESNPFENDFVQGDQHRSIYILKYI